MENLLPFEDNFKDEDSDIEKPNWRDDMSSMPLTDDKIIHLIEQELSNAYTLSDEKASKQRMKFNNAYHREPLGNEANQTSKYVSPIITQAVNQVRAFIVDPYSSNQDNIMDFNVRNGLLDENTPSEAIEDIAKDMSDYTDYIFHQKNEGKRFIDESVFNMCLNKLTAARITEDTNERSEVITETFADENEIYMFLQAHQDLELYDGIDIEETSPQIDDEEESFLTGGGRVDNEDGTITQDFIREWTEELPHVEALAPEELFISKVAENEDEARVVGRVHRVYIGDLASKYGGDVNFWRNVNDSHSTWLHDAEFAKKWTYDTNTRDTSLYTEGNDEEAGIGVKEIIIVDAEVYLDINDNLDKKLYRTIMAGRTIIHMQVIPERSFIIGGLIPTGKRWIYMGIADLLWQEFIEETNQGRAYLSAVIEAHRDTPVLDGRQIRLDDWENRGLRNFIRRKAGSRDGSPAIETYRKGGANPQAKEVMEFLAQKVLGLTGVGKNFAGVQPEDIGGMNQGDKKIEAVANASELVLNYFAERNAIYLQRVLVKLFKTVLRSRYADQNLPTDLMSGLTEDFTFNPVIGYGGRQAKQQEMTNIVSIVAQSLETGIATPQNDYNAKHDLMKAFGARDITRYLTDPSKVEQFAQSPEGQALIQKVQKETEQKVVQSIEGQKITAETEKLKTDAQKNLSTIQTMMTKDQVLQKKAEYEEDKAAIQIAMDKLEFETDTEMSAFKIAMQKRQMEIDYEIAMLDARLTLMKIEQGDSNASVKLG